MSEDTGIADLPTLIRQWIAAEREQRPEIDARASFKNALDGLALLAGEAPSKEALVATATRVWGAVERLLPTDDDQSILDALREHTRAFSLETGEMLAGARARVDRMNAAINGGEYDVHEGTPRGVLDRHVAELTAFEKMAGGAQARLAMLRDTVIFGNMLASVDGQIIALALVRWADAAFPQVEMGHKYAAALLVSTTTPDVLERVRLPWPALVIELPAGLLNIDDPAGGTRPLRRIVVTTIEHKSGERRWAYVGMTDSSLSIWRNGVTTTDLMAPHMTSDVPVEDALPITDTDDRIMVLVGRLIIATCLAMSDPANVEEVGIGHREHAQAQKRKRRFGRPIVRTFKIGKPIKLDFRERIEAYVKGTLRVGQKLTVQSLVCGHFKGQHHGPRNSLYKIIWREPFWRGPENSPILVRPHAIKEPA